MGSGNGSQRGRNYESGSDFMQCPVNAWLTWIDYGLFMEITINIHASLSYVLTSIGSNSIPTMDVMYTIFGTLLRINSAFFALLLHILYAIFFAEFGMKASLRLTEWVEAANPAI